MTTVRRVLVWQWGRRGAGPRFAADLATHLADLPETRALLSLSAQSELLQTSAPTGCDLPYPTYHGLAGFLWRMATIPRSLPMLMKRLRTLAPDVAICAMPAPLDLLMGTALRRLGIPFFVVIHDADAHPGDGFPLQMALQRRLVRRAAGLVTLSNHVADQLAERGEIAGRPVVRLYHPPFAFGPPPPPPRSEGGPWRLLFFGRLLPYKGLDLFAAALAALRGKADVIVRVEGQGPESPSLKALRAMPAVSVANRWVPETEIGGLLAWADMVVLSHTEASQSGVASAAVAAGRYVVATRVGGLAEQLGHEPLARLSAPEPQSLADAILAVIAAPPSAVSKPQPGWPEMATILMRQVRHILGG